MSKLPRWLLISIIVVALGALITGLVFLISSEVTWMQWTGLILSGVLVIAIVVLATTIGPQLIKLYKFQKKMNAEDGNLRGLEGLLMQGKVHEATLRFNRLMKDAPDSAYLYYMKAMFMKQTGNNLEAYDAAKNALKFSSTDASLQASLQQTGGQMGQPTTVTEFKAQLKEIIAELEPKIKLQQAKKEKAVQKRKKKSR